jgi:hypothetical protein
MNKKIIMPIALLTLLSLAVFVSAQCTDSDGGINYIKKGTTTNGSEEKTDYCEDNKSLIEYFCTPEGNIEDITGGISPGSSHYCENGAKIYESSNGILIEEDFGELIFSDIYPSGGCREFIPNLVDCVQWIGKYHHPSDGIDNIYVSVRNYQNNFDNNMFVNATNSPYSSIYFEILQENLFGNNVFIINYTDNPGEVNNFIIWYNQNKVIEIQIEDWDTSKVSEDVVDLLISSYLEKYPSNLDFEEDDSGTQCTENWQCSDWSTCTNNQQTKTCTDSNSCGTTTNKPSTSKSCTVQQQEQEQSQEQQNEQQQETTMHSPKFYIKNKEVSVERNVGGGNIINVEKESIKTFLEVIEENEKIYIKTSEGNKEIKILSEEAITNAQKIDTIEKVEIEEDKGKAVYSIHGTKRARLFFIFPVLAEVEQKIDVEDGSLVSTKKPWWHFLALGI